MKLLKKQEAYEKPIKISGSNYTTGYLLDFSHHQNYFKLTSVDSSRQTNTSKPKQFNFARKLDEEDGETMFFIAEKQQKSILNFSLDSLIVTE